MKSINLVLLAKLFVLYFFSSIAYSDTINWVGCGISKKAYMNEMSKSFKKKTGIDINIQGGGATKGIRKVSDKSADLGGSCRLYLPGNDLESSVSFEPLAWDALAVIVHKNNPVKNITLEQLKSIYMGELTSWKELGGPDHKIELFTRQGKISGVGFMIRKLLFYSPYVEFDSSQEFKSSGPLEKSIQQNIYALGISGISSARLRDLKILNLNGVSPDTESIKKGGYLLYRPLYLTYRKDSPRLKEIKAFIAFAHSKEGRKIMIKNGVVPYLRAMQLIFKQVEQERRAQRHSSTNYNYTNKYVY
ncbi:MAG: phosphate ABC transporter substrate-binding protein [endosymbiont of Galathealinum brachiosum]|uniref:Phosphate ABC transporter substrate-binding protein n=1 Tax=endosymbiont of Galathealinum brachiosum TaxID=2200906 RepID=A0A370DGP5_9GAMM|nr:MAG: phosphate ABC transporter substrate-binding protein [endosymbiont of Galathealinum brachiosum]